MNLGNRAVFSVHRITGTVIALFFFMWFFTGLVMIYHGFPRIDKSRVLAAEAPLPASTVLPDTLPDGLKSLSITSAAGRCVIDMATADTAVTCLADGRPVGEVTFADAEATANRWLDARISRVDTLSERDRWTMYTRYLDELPLYKFYYDDGDGGELYVSSRTAEPLQYTTAATRAWAWAGAIPHKLYFPAIRSDVDVWKGWLLTGAGLCLAATLSGIYVALFLWIRTRRHTGRWINPMRGRIMRLHFTLGLIFAIPLVTWSISGLFAMQKVPQWMVSVDGPENVSYTRLWGRGMLPTESYRLSYSAIHNRYPEMRRVEYGRAGSTPTVTVTTPDSTVVLDASYPTPRRLMLTEADVESAAHKLFGDETAIDVSLIADYDNLYFSVLYELRLPVYRVRADNADGSVLYIDPDSGDITYLNDNRKLRKILFSGLHYLNLRPFAGHHALWTVTIWLLCLTGMVFCLTSAWLGAMYIGRLCRRHQGKRR